MKKLNLLIFIVLILCFSACAGLSSVSVDYQSTLTALESASTARETELLSQISTLQSENEKLTASVNGLTTARDSAEKKANTATTEKNNALKKADALESLFLFETGDDEGEYIFCKDAFSTSFAYVDKVSMRKELIKYLANKKSLNPDYISSEHSLMWSNVSDGLLKLQGGGYMYPYFVSFEDLDFGRPDYVFDLTYSCYLDFPVLERMFNNNK